MKNLRTLTYEQLVTLKTKVDAAIRRADEKQRRDLNKMLETVRALSMRRPSPVAERGRSLKGRKLKPKYRNPADRTQTWAGRGLQPHWIRAGLKRGKKLSSFLIQ